jgi:hypothetical protein
MAEFLVKAVDHTHPDPDEDRAGAYKVGDIVVVFPDGHTWGSEETLPKFVVVKCPGLDVATARARVEQWDFEYDLTILQRSLPLDGWRFRIDNLQRHADGRATPQAAKFADFFTQWGATFVRMDAEGPVLDWSVVAGATSPAFLGVDPASVGVTITETAYDGQSGIHTLEIDYSGYTGPSPNVGLQIAKRIVEFGGVLGAVTPPVIEYTLQRDVVLDSVKRDLTGLRGAYKRRRYSLDAAQVAAVVAAGGSITVTPAQLVANVIDHRA